MQLPMLRDCFGAGRFHGERIGVPPITRPHASHLNPNRPPTIHSPRRNSNEGFKRSNSLGEGLGLFNRKPLSDRQVPYCADGLLYYCASVIVHTLKKKNTPLTHAPTHTQTHARYLSRSLGLIKLAPHFCPQAHDHAHAHAFAFASRRRV